MVSILDRLRKRAPKIVVKAKLFGVHIRGNKRKDLGLLSEEVVTDAFVAYLVDEMQTATAIDAFSWHACGTDATAPAVGDTALITDTGITRVDGTQAEGASANIYQTVATMTMDASETIQEHGVFSAITGGTLMDRSTFTGIVVVASDQIEFTYELTFTAGG